MVAAEIMVTSEYIGAIMDLCQERRGIYEGMEYMEATRALLRYDPAPERDHLRLLRRTEIPLQRLCFL